MTSAILQCMAVITMMIDHIGFKLFPFQQVFRMIGRLAFPIFVFMLVEGFVHTSSRKKYFLRLAVFAVVSELPYKIFHYGVPWTAYLQADWYVQPWKNVFFELLLVFLAVWFLAWGKEKHWLFYLGAAAMPALAYGLGTMYGFYGVAMGICFYLFREKRWLILLCLVGLTLFYCISRNNWLQIYAIAAAVPLCLYNGRRGRRLPKYFGYAFYPVHLLAIYGIYWLQTVL